MEPPSHHCLEWSHCRAVAKKLATGTHHGKVANRLGLLTMLQQLTVLLMQYCEPNTLAAVEQAVSNNINTAKLLAVEKLLWGHTPKRPGQGKQGKS